MILRTGVCAVVLMAISGSALAQDAGAAKPKPGGKQPDPAAMMAAYEKAAAPGDQHKQLQKMVGKWSIALKTWMAPGQPPTETAGTATVKSLLGDRFVQMEVASTFMGKPFNGIGIHGYDNTKKKYVGTWIDSMSTGIMRSEGTADATGKVLTAQATASDPLTGKESKMRIVQKWESDDKIVEEFFEKRGPKEQKVMEITYTRTK
jgi:hypothetical protein